MKLINRSSYLLLVSVLWLLLLFAACSDDSSTSPATNDLPEVNSYLNTLPPWEQYANVQDTSDAPAGDAIAEMSGMVQCTETPYSITQNPEEIVTFGSAPNVLYLGSLIQGDSYLGGLGSMVELPIRQRAPLTIAVNLFSGTPVTATVDNPNAASVQSALNTIIAGASSGHQSGNRIYFNRTETYSLAQGALSLGVSVKYMGASAHAQLGYSASDEEHTITAYLKQIMYEAYIVTPQTPAEFFSSDFTTAKLDEQIELGNIGPDNLPVYVGRIQYGRMMMFTMTSTAHIDSMMLAVGGSYNNGLQNYSLEVQASLRNILQTSRYTVVTVGGTSETTLGLLRSGELDDFFKQDDPITSAVPLGYALYNLADGSLAKVSETTNYTVTECSPAGAVVYVNKTEWQNAVSAVAANASILELLTSAENLVMADEVDAPPTANLDLGSMLSFDSSVTHYPFKFALRAVAAGANLIFEDQEAGGPAWAFDMARSISIGDVGNYTNDDFSIYTPEWAPNTAVFAIGITVADNSCQDGEYVSATGVGGFSLQADTSPHCPGRCGFLGIVSTVPLTGMFLNVVTGDEIFVRDFCFGVLQWED